MDAYDDPPVVHSLIEKVRQWALAKGAKKIIRPLGFSIKNLQENNQNLKTSDKPRSSLN